MLAPKYHISLKKHSWDKRSSLFWPAVSDEVITFNNIAAREISDDSELKAEEARVAAYNDFMEKVDQYLNAPDATRDQLYKHFTLVSYDGGTVSYDGVTVEWR